MFAPAAILLYLCTLFFIHPNLSLMSNIYRKTLVTFLVTLLLAAGLPAQTVLTSAQQKDDKVKADGDTPVKAVAAIGTNEKKLFGMPVTDIQTFNRFVTDKGHEPSQKPVAANAAEKADEEEEYQYRGYCPSAVVTKDDDGNVDVSPGLLDFNAKPFATTLSSTDKWVSQFSYVSKGKLYCFTPKSSEWRVYEGLTLTAFDAITLKQLWQKSSTNPSKLRENMPYIIAYDAQRDVVYAISTSDSENGGLSQSYYLNIVDTASCKLKRLGKIGEIRYDDNYKGFNARGFAVKDGRLLVLYDDESVLYIGEINPVTLEVKVVGRPEIADEYSYSLQGMTVDDKTGDLIISTFDLAVGGAVYRVTPTDGAGGKDNILKTETLATNEEALFSFPFFYEKFNALPNSLGDMTDLTTATTGGETRVSFTVPSVNNKGEKLTGSSKTVTCNIYVDNVKTVAEGLPATISYGDHVSATIKPGDGLHTVTVQLIPADNNLGEVRNSATLLFGYDAPSVVSNLSLKIENNRKATITWTAPAEGQHASFGSTFDASDLTYTVVRNTDNKVIADGITATTVTDEDLGEAIQTYTYTVTAHSHGLSSLATTTNKVSAGLYLPLPYLNEFSDANSLDGYANINGGAGYTTWSWNGYKKLLVSGFGIADSWLIMPNINLSTDALYSISYNLYGNGYLKTTVGTGMTIADQTNVLIDRNKYSTNNAYEQQEAYFRPATSGYYNFALYNYSLNKDQGWNIDNLQVKEIARATAPDKVRAPQFTPDPKGALGGTISVKAPATTIDGNNLTSLSKVVVYDLSGNELGASGKAVPGADVSIKVKAVHGFNTYKIVAVNENGEGWPVQLKTFVGPDTPKPVTNLKARWGEDGNVVNLSWTPSTEGQNGGYVDPSSFVYTLYRYDPKSEEIYIPLGESPQGEENVEVEIKDADLNAQQQYIFAITAKNTEGESAHTQAGILLGKPYTLPFVEPFNVKKLNYEPWLIYKGKNGQAWTTDEGIYNAKIQPENGDSLQLLFRNTGMEDGSSQFVTPIIDFSNAKHPVYSVWLHHSDAMPEKAYVVAQATIDGSDNFIAIGDTARLTGNNGWTEHLFDLTPIAGKKAQIALNAYVPDGASRIFTDNWAIREATGKDLALESISQPYMPVVGDTATITVAVVNKGLETAQNYSVLFTVNDEIIGEEEADEALPLGKTKTFNFTLPITAAQKNLIYSAKVICDGDENEDNNYSSEVELSPRQIDLPAPTELALKDNNKLTWTAPAVEDGRKVLLDFEDVPAFTRDNIDGWTTYDGDGHLTLGFAQYDENYWPYFLQPMAWMTWSAKEAGAPTASIWQPYEGEKCLISFGNYGADADGRPNTEVDDDWFISPEVKGGTEFSFFSLGNRPTCSIEVLTSETDNEPSSFTNRLITIEYMENTSVWVPTTLTLPDNAKYVAFHTVRNDFGIMLDNISYTAAKSPVLKGYRVYNGTAPESLVQTTQALTQGDGTYAVSAIYDLGESALSNTVGVGAGISGPGAGKVFVRGGRGMITISGAEGKRFAVYNVSGVRSATGTAIQTENVKISSGVYLVRINGKTFKVLVK